MATDTLSPTSAIPVYGTPLYLSDGTTAPAETLPSTTASDSASTRSSEPSEAPTAGADPSVNSDSQSVDSIALSQEVASLQAKLAEMEGDNNNLRRAISNKRSRPMDSFAEALRGSIDGLQRQLGSMSNPTTDFAIKRFNLEANVLLDVSSIGSLVYRVVEPDEDIEPHKLAKIAMEIVPVPKSNGSLSWDLEHFDPFQPIDQLALPSFGELDQLRTEGLCTIGEFLQASTRARALTHLTQMLGFDRARLANWRQEAELLLIRGLQERHLKILRELGINDIQALSIQAPAPLSAAFNARGYDLGVAEHIDISSELVDAWIKSAKAFVGHRTSST